MGRSRYKIYEEHYPYFITSSFSKGVALFADPEIADIVLDSLVYMKKEHGIQLYAYVLMRNHFHCILEGDNLSSVLRKFKSYTARRIIDHLTDPNRTLLLRRIHVPSSHPNSLYKVWQEGFHPKQIKDEAMMIQKTEYIHYNPVKAGFVDKPIDWRYSSARNYAGLEPLISVSLFEG